MFQLTALLQQLLILLHFLFQILLFLLSGPCQFLDPVLKCLFLYRISFYLLLFNAVVEISLFIQLLRHYITVLPKLNLQLLIVNLLHTLFGLSLFHNHNSFLVQHPMGKTIKFVIPNSISFQIKAQYMLRVFVVLIGICVFVSPTAYGPADHTNPIVLLLRTFMALGILVEPYPADSADRLLFWFLL